MAYLLYTVCDKMKKGMSWEKSPIKHLFTTPKNVTFRYFSR